MSVVLYISNLSRNLSRVGSNTTITPAKIMNHISRNVHYLEDDIEFESKCASMYANRMMSYDEDLSSHMKIIYPNQIVYKPIVYYINDLEYD